MRYKQILRGWGAHSVSGNLLDLGKAVNFTYPNLPELEAIPVRDQNEVLVGGDFVASGTLHVDYQ